MPSPALVWRAPALLLALFLLNLPTAARAQRHALADPLAEQVITSFGGKSFDELYARFSDLLMQPLPEEARRVATARCRARLALAEDPAVPAAVRRRLEPVLALYHMEKITVLVYEDRRPSATTIPGTVLMLSTGLLEIATTDDELRAVAAHELAHDLLYTMASEARFQENFSRLRQVELMCDAFSVAALAKLGGDLSSVERIMRKALTERDAQSDGPFTHPLLVTRLKVVATLIEAFAPSSDSSS